MESLPLELIQSIGGFLAPEAIDPFTSTSKHIRRVLTRLIDEHQSLKRDFEHAICGENQPHGSIVDLLFNVITRPHLHYYIRKLSIEDWPNEPQSETERGLRISSASRSQMRQALHISPASLSSAIARLTTEDGVFPLLLWELSELRVLRLGSEPGDESTIFNVLLEIEGFPSYSLVPLLPGFLQQLRELQLDTNREGQEWMVGTAKLFANLCPSLRRISVNGINESSPDDWSIKLLAKPSNVEHLEFTSCVIGDKLMHRLLQGFQKLKTLRINEGSAHDMKRLTRMDENQRTTRIDCYWLCVSLQTHCKESLQSLIMSIPPSYSSEVANFLGDISAFRGLRYLELYMEGLIRSEDSDEAVLPNSIEELRIDCDDDSGDFEIMCTESKSLVEASRRKNPNLKQVTVECHLIRNSHPETLESEQRFQMFGVDFAFLKGSSTRP